MPTVVRDLPFGLPSPGHLLPVPGGPGLPLRAGTLVVWVSVTGPDAVGLPAGAPRYPTVLDTGFNDAFLIAARRLLDWGPPGVYKAIRPTGRVLRYPVETIPLYEAAVWLHPNIPGRVDPDSGADPYRLLIPTGIAVATAGGKAERPIPLLGLTAVRYSGLRVDIDGGRGVASISAPDPG